MVAKKQLQLIARKKREVSVFVSFCLHLFGALIGCLSSPCVATPLYLHFQKNLSSVYGSLHLSCQKPFIVKGVAAHLHRILLSVKES